MSVDATQVDPPVAFQNVGHCRLAFRYRAPKPAARAKPGLVWLGGFKSDMMSTKAAALDSFAASEGRGCLRFDYSGHGTSEGRFEDGTIGRWAEDAALVQTLREWLEPVASLIDPFEFEKMRYRFRYWGIFDCNWKVALEAFLEPYHVQGTHPQLIKYGDFYSFSKAFGLHG